MRSWCAQCPARLVPQITLHAKAIFDRLKTELFYPRDWKSTTLEQIINEVDGYIRWYNEKRIKISLGARSPIEYRNSLGIVR